MDINTELFDKNGKTLRVGDVIKCFIENEIAGTLLTDEDIILGLEKRKGKKTILVMYQDTDFRAFKEWII